MNQKSMILSVIFILMLAMNAVGVYAETPDRPEAVLDIIEHLQLPSGDLEEEAIIEALAANGIDARASEFAYVYNFSDLEAALANPNVGIILLLNDIQLEYELLIDRDISMSGVMGSTITTNGYYLYVYSDDDVSLVFSNVTLDGQQQDGGIYFRSSVHIKGLTVQNCVGPVGAITTSPNRPSRMGSDTDTYIVETPYRYELVLEDCTIRNNTSGLDGGGVFAGGTTAVTVKNCDITGNQAQAGGGIFACSALTIENSSITHNTATREGGGIMFVTNYRPAVHSVAIKDSDIMYNQAANGGGLHLESVDNVFENTNISFNTATYGGGVFAATLDDNFSISGGIYENNTAQQGGAFGLYPAYTTSGGSIYQNGYMYLSDMLIKDNVATGDGGGIFINPHVSNTVEDRYGRIEVSENVIFSGNTASTGYYMTDEEDIAIYEAQIHATQLSSPFTQYAYNNFDISYTKGVELKAIHVNFFLRHSDAEADTVIALYAGQALGDNLPDGPVVAGLFFVGWTDGNGNFYNEDTIITEAVNLYPAYIPN